jgi:hypothetical protein
VHTRGTGDAMKAQCGLSLLQSAPRLDGLGATRTMDDLHHSGDRHLNRFPLLDLHRPGGYGQRLRTANGRADLTIQADPTSRTIHPLISVVAWRLPNSDRRSGKVRQGTRRVN